MGPAGTAGRIWPNFGRHLTFREKKEEKLQNGKTISPVFRAFRGLAQGMDSFFARVPWFRWRWELTPHDFFANGLTSEVGRREPFFENIGFGREKLGRSMGPR